MAIRNSNGIDEEFIVGPFSVRVQSIRGVVGDAEYGKALRVAIRQLQEHLRVIRLTPKQLQARLLRYAPDKPITKGRGQARKIPTFSKAP